MKYMLLQVMCLVCYSGIASAQVLRPEEVVKMRRAGAQKIDSMMKAKGFKSIAAPSDGNNTSVGYLYQAVEDDARVQRLFVVGWRRPSDYVETEYDVWQEKEARDWIDQLLAAGFKRPKQLSPDAQRPIHFRVYRKNGNTIFYNEESDSHSGRTRYRFTITTKDYKGDGL